MNNLKKLHYPDQVLSGVGVGDGVGSGVNDGVLSGEGSPEAAGPAFIASSVFASTSPEA